ncbi:MAG TPA: tRNA (adenosine(37)-N6)-dimethylallyltransferase MiaA [Thermoanaerobaculia bacterium]|nr:tRNA (adenosine(37)-N6)-dimethylallyltransferase MiaA [Thermoanaerobaculia bacterium]
MTTDGVAPLVLVLGPTGSGKTKVAHEIARRAWGEVVSADAFAVYRGLDVGTAKPTPEQRAEVPYHLVDVAEPEEKFSAGRWAGLAREAVAGIADRGRVPVVAGGSGFYVAALLGGLPAGEVRDDAIREGLAGWAARHGPAAAHRFLTVNDAPSAAKIAPQNLKATLRALEILLVTGTAASSRRPEGDGWVSRFHTLKVVLVVDRAQLHARIEDRVRRMLRQGWREEVRRLLDRGLSRDSNAFQATGYGDVADWVLGRATEEETQERIVAATRALAKRQLTWLAREQDAHRDTPERAASWALSRITRSGDGETE